MHEKVLTVTLNPAIDTSLWVKRLEDGEVCRTSREEYQAGGKGVNISRTLKKFGVDTPAFFLCGERSAAEYLSLLKQEGIRCHYVPAEGAVRENIHIITEDGRFYKVNRNGLQADEKRLRILARMVREASDEDTILVVSGSLPEGMDAAMFGTFVKEISAKAGRLVLDTSALHIGQLMELKPYLIKPNLEEFCRMTNQKKLEAQQAMRRAQKYAGKGIEQILLSLGSDGLALVTPRRILAASVPSVKAVNTVGAGDNALAGFLLGLAGGETPERCVELAAAFGSASVLLDGTHPPRREDVRRLCEQITVGELG